MGINKLGLASSVQLARFNESAAAFVDLRDAESRAVFLSHSFWPEFPPIVAAFLKNGGDCFDIGANFGLVSFGTSPLVENVQFHLFEANPNIVNVLRKSTEVNPTNHFFINHACVSDEPGTSYLTLPDASWGHGYIGEKGFPVNNLILDEYIETNNIQRISFMKIDIEGYELRALRGAENSLKSGIIEAAFIEVCPETLERAGTSANELLDYLRSLNFSLYFCNLWNKPDPYKLTWQKVDINGTKLFLAPAYPLPSTYTTGDVLAIHRS